MNDGVHQIESWLLKQNGQPSGEIDPDLDLFESGVLSSLQVMELLVTIEQASGHRIDRLSVGPNDLKTLRQIDTRFFAATAADAEPHVGG